jgi:hypothetical protein
MPTTVHTVEVMSDGGIAAARVSPIMAGGGAFTTGVPDGEQFVYPEVANDGKTPNPLRQEWRVDLEVPGFAEHVIGDGDRALFAPTYDEAVALAEEHAAMLDRVWAVVQSAK